MSLILLPEDIPSALEDAGIETGRVTDDEVWALCPQHLKRMGREDTSPTNFSVNLDTGLCYCFACGYRAGFSTLIAQTLFNGDSWAASGWLSDRGASLVDAIGRLERKVKKTHVMAGTKVDDPDFEYVLMDTPPDYALEERFITRASSDLYRLAWDEREQGWVIPFIGADDRVKGWQWKRGGRFVNHPAALQKRQFLFGEQVASGRRAILLESPLDVVRLHSAGVPNGVSPFGVQVHEVQIQALIRNYSSLVLALDNDPPGRQKTRELLDLLGRRMPVSVYNYEGIDAKDIGDMENDDDVVWGLENAIPSALIPATPQRR